MAACSPVRGCVLTVTQFDGIPMADVFKVMHYWCFETERPSPSASSSASANGGLGGGRTVVRVGVAVHFIKSSMLKSQISSGVRDELLGLSQRWCLFAEARAVHSGRSSLRRLSGAAAAAAVGGNGSDRRGSKRLSLKQLADTGVVSELRGDSNALPSPSSSSSASGAGAGLGAGEVSAACAASASVHATTERHLLIALAVLVVVLAVQGLYSRSLSLQLRDLTEALAALKAAVEQQASALEELEAL